ncbi:MAG: hypothetical protein EOP29_26915, partial [Rhodococcus sp. (in: high G+C Gram-positive bacteria)]
MKIAFSTTDVPTGTTPHVACTLPNGYPMLMTADFVSSTAGYSFTVTDADRSSWTTLPKSQAFGTSPDSSTGAASAQLAPVARISDNVGNYVTFSYASYSTFNNGVNGTAKRLTGIYDSDGTALLTLGLTSDGYITSANDRYGRSVYYGVGTYGTTNVSAPWQQSFRLLNNVSQIVPTGTTSPAVRFTYGYGQYSNGDGNETVPYLHTIAVPSPTGTGMATATINYDGSGYVSSVIDGNGNGTFIIDSSAVAGTGETTVEKRDPSGNVVSRRKVQFDGAMNQTKEINGLGQTVWTASFSSPNAPSRPSSITDGNGRTWQATWDRFNHLLTLTTPKGTVTTNTWSTANFALGELVETQTGSKTSTQYAYNEPSGQIAAVYAPIPGESGTGNRQATTYSYDFVGNLTQVLSPGNDAVSQHSTTLSTKTISTYRTSA